MEDNQIVELYWQRDTEAISETAKKYGAYCFAIAENILRNAEDSEECVNDTWLHAWNAMPPQRPNVLRMFLARIVRNLSFDRFHARNAGKRGGGCVCVYGGCCLETSSAISYGRGWGYNPSNECFNKACQCQ